MKNQRVERLIILCLAEALVLFSVIRVFWIPYDRTRFLRPIPSGVVIISSHRDLGSRPENLSTNVFLKAFFDPDGKAIKKIREHRYAVSILGARLITAYIPDFNHSSGPAVIISSWIGGWTPVLRWALWIHPPADIVPIGNYNGHRLWTWKHPVQIAGAAGYFSFAIDEGVFIGCLSRERNGIAYLMKNYDGRKDSILNIPQCRLLVSSPGADQIWLRVDLPNTAQNKSFFAVCSLDAFKNDYLSATIRFDPEIKLNDYAGLDQKPAEIGKICARLPSIVAMVPSEMAAGGLNGLVSPAWERAIKPVIASLSGSNNVSLLAVFTGEYGGKLGREPLMITVPTVLLAVSGIRPERTKADFMALLDLINTRYRLGLIVNTSLSPAAQCPIYAVESTSGTLLRSLPVEDQPAFAFYNDLFLLASNSVGLRKLLLDFQSQAVFADVGINNRLSQAGNRQKKAFIWIDPGEGGKALRFALTASIMMLDAENRSESKQNTISILKAACSWLESIGGLNNCEVWLESENGKAVVRLEIGSNPDCSRGLANNPSAKMRK